MGLTVLLLQALLSTSAGDVSQFIPTPNPNTERAQQSYRLGWEYLSSENWEEAAKQIQQLRAQMQRSQMRREADASFSLTSDAPAFVSLALGSAYFRLGRMSEAEREYKATINTDPKAGEAHNNLAVVYMLTGRIDEA